MDTKIANSFLSLHASLLDEGRINGLYNHFLIISHPRLSKFPHNTGGTVYYNIFQNNDKKFDLATVPDLIHTAHPALIGGIVSEDIASFRDFQSCITNLTRACCSNYPQLIKSGTYLTPLRQSLQVTALVMAWIIHNRRYHRCHHRRHRPPHVGLSTPPDATYKSPNLLQVASQPKTQDRGDGQEVHRIATNPSEHFRPPNKTKAAATTTATTAITESSSHQGSGQQPHPTPTQFHSNMRNSHRMKPPLQSTMLLNTRPGVYQAIDIIHMSALDTITRHSKLSRK